MLFNRLTLCVVLLSSAVFSQSVILINQVGYEQFGPKSALIDLNQTAIAADSFQILDAQKSVLFKGQCGTIQNVPNWKAGIYLVCDFSEFKEAGQFSLQYGSIESDPFYIGKGALFEKTYQDAVSFFNKMRNTDDDSQIALFGSPDAVKNVNGGWNDATGDRGKYLSHLAFSNHLTPQQIPMVIWTLLKSADVANLSSTLKTTVFNEAAWGADYLIRVLDPEGFFYMIVFDRWGWDEKREICTWIFDPSIPETYLQNGQKTTNYQAAFREGGGMAIASLARAARLNINATSSEDYLNAAKKAYAHLVANNLKYCDDNTENIIDHYCALMAAVELFRATSENSYQTDAHSRAAALLSLISDDGFFWSDSAHTRPYYHAAEEGLPIVALIEYLTIAPEKSVEVKTAIQKIWQGYQTRSFEEANPFSYLKLAYSESSGSGGLGSNLALKKPVTVSRVESGYTAGNICDGNMTSRWASGQPYSDTEWVIIDLEAEYEISSIVCVWEAAYGKEYEIQVSTDNQQWKTVASITNDGAGRKVHSFEPALGRYVKMQGKLRGIEYGFSMYEFEVYGRQKVSAKPVQSAFFMPHVNETGYWWQGENARLASLTSAAYLSYLNGISMSDKILASASSHLDWILGKNPFGVCMMYGYGTTNYPDYPGKAGYTLVNVQGGVCNGITGDTSGVDSPQWKPYEDFDTENWRWIEQWLPHNAWYVLACASQGAIDWENKIPVRKNKSSSALSNPLKYRIAGNNMMIDLRSFSNTGKSTITLQAASGRVVRTMQLKENQSVISLNNLSNGLYLVSICNGNRTHTVPLMIAR